MQELLKGAAYLWLGFQLIHKQGIRRYAYLPMAINTLLFSIAIWFGITEFDGWLHTLMPSWLPDWLASIVMWLIWPLFVLLLALIVFFTFTLIANILAAPFNGVLSEVVEKRLSGESPPQISFLQMLKESPRMVLNEFRKIAYLLVWMLPLLLLSVIPVLNLIAPILWVFFSSWTFALDYHDYPMGNHQLSFSRQRSILKKHRKLALGFGLATLVATMIPLLNFLVIPAAVAGATALYVENLTSH